MKISDLVALSAKNLSRRKGRTALTVVGVVVGTCAVIVMISLGIAINQSTDEMLQSWGDLTEIEVYGGNTSVSYYGGGVYSSSSGGDEAVLNAETVQTFSSMEHVLGATPYYQPWNLQGNIYAGKNDRYSSQLWNLYGVLPDALEPMGFQLADGHWPDDSVSYPKGKIPVLVGRSAAYNFYDTRKSPNSSKYSRWEGQTDAAGNPVEPFFDINKEKMTLVLSDGDPDNPKTREWELVVVGTLETDDQQWWTRSGIVMRIQDVRMLEEAYKALTGDKTKTTDTYDQVYVKVDDLKNVEDVAAKIEAMGFSTWSMTQMREDMQAQVVQQQLILAGLAAVSLLVAALNIANTMTMAIYERTREIGVMKVLGCELGNIRAMFLIESGFIGFIGGVIGSVVSLIISFVLNNITTIMMLLGGEADLSGLVNMMGGWGYSSTISIIPPWLILAALAFATLIGLLSGIAPAGRAVKISALEAIRHE